MTTDRFDIKRADDGWSIHHAGDVSTAYATRKAAFEAAALAGADALRLGNGLIISVEPLHANETAMATSTPTLAES